MKMDRTDPYLLALLCWSCCNVFVYLVSPAAAGIPTWKRFQNGGKRQSELKPRTWMTISLFLHLVPTSFPPLSPSLSLLLRHRHRRFLFLLRHPTQNSFFFKVGYFNVIN